MAKRIETERATSCAGGAGVAIVLLMVSGSAGCASGEAKKTFEGALARAAVTIEVADTQDARQYAPAEIGIANEKLAAARQTAQSGDERAANRLLVEALVNVDLAKAKAAAGRVKAEAAKLDEAPAGPDGNDVQQPPLQ